MTKMIKRYVPYAIIILLVYMLFPLFFVFTGAEYQAYTPIIYDVIFPVVAIGCSVVYAKKYGIDFFFSLVAPIIYIPSMIIYNGISANNIIFVAIYLVSSIFGLFLGDMFFGQKKNTEAPLDVDLDIEESEPVVKRKAPERQRSKASAESQKSTASQKVQNDDFFENYSPDNLSDAKSNAEDEIDKILKEIHNRN